PADDIEDPGKTIPRVLVWGTFTVLGIYLLAYTGVILLVPASVLLNSTAPFADATVAVIGSAGASLIAVGAIIATLGTLNVQILVVGQIVRAVALDKLFPQKIA
ncbi:MAG: amino acid permease, partial [Pseudomonadales bacterium]|nr:amino acid permease [Pseudomonadales bacterium]